MSDIKFTPGPWVATCNDVGGLRPVGDDGVRYWDITEGHNEKYRGAVCNVSDARHIDGIKLDERDANVRLICAAPEMFEALKEAEDVLNDCAPNDSVSDALKAVRAALSKASTP